MPYTVGNLENGGGEKRLHDVSTYDTPDTVFRPHPSAHNFKIFSEVGGLQGPWTPENSPTLTEVLTQRRMKQQPECHKR